MGKDIITVTINAKPEKVYGIITDIDKIKIWEPSHKVLFVKHEWLPSSGQLRKGAVITIKAGITTFVAKCVEIRENTVRWNFIRGALKGTEFWIIRPTPNGCEVIKRLEYKVPVWIDRLLWRLFGRRLHNWASLKQLKSIKRMAETDA